MELTELLFSVLQKVVTTAIGKKVALESEQFLARRRVAAAVDASVVQVVESISPFISAERLNVAKQNVLMVICERELLAVINDPSEIFAASLDGRRLFDLRYSSKSLPREITDEGLGDLFAAVFPHMANLAFAVPSAIEHWKLQGFKEGFRRLDEITSTLGRVAIRLDQAANKDAEASDRLMRRIRQSLLQRVEFQLDLAGLRGDRPDAVPLENCFIFPTLARTANNIQTGAVSQQQVSSEEELSVALDNQPRILIVGVPGAGKTTLCQWVQRMYLRDPLERFAVLVRLRDIQALPELPSHVELTRKAVGTHLRDEVDHGTLRSWSYVGALTFILDGFDEVPLPRRDAIVDWVADLAAVLGRSQLVITSRPISTDHLTRLGRDYVEWTILPFDRAQLTTYISKWYGTAPLLQGKQLLVSEEVLADTWLADPVLRPLTGSPLMLATLLMVHHLDGELPRGRSLVYDRYAAGMLGLWDSRWGIPSSVALSEETKRRILTRLALTMHLNDRDQISDAEMLVATGRVLKDLSIDEDPTLVRNHLRERTGLLVGPGTWSFVHKSVAEYFVACAIQDADYIDPDGQRLDRLRLFRERQNDRWNTVLFFWAGLTSPGDLQGFVEHAIQLKGAGDFALALGLFRDQLQSYRFPEPWRSNTLLTIIEAGLHDADVSSFQLISPIPCPVPDRVVVKVRETSVRAVSMDVASLNMSAAVLRQCVELANLPWRRLRNAHKSIRFSLWNSLMGGVRDIAGLAELLEPPVGIPWSSDEQLTAFAAALDRAMALDSARLNIVDVVRLANERLQSIHPRVAILVACRLVASLRDLGVSRTNSSRTQEVRVNRVIVQLVSALCEAGQHKSDPDWLMGTGTVRFSGASVDVLAEVEWGLHVLLSGPEGDEGRLRLRCKEWTAVQMELREAGLLEADHARRGIVKRLRFLGDGHDGLLDCAIAARRALDSGTVANDNAPEGLSSGADGTPPDALDAFRLSFLQHLSVNGDDRPDRAAHTSRLMVQARMGPAGDILRQLSHQEGQSEVVAVFVYLLCRSPDLHKAAKFSVWQSSQDAGLQGLREDRLVFAAAQDLLIVFPPNVRFDGEPPVISPAEPGDALYAVGGTVLATPGS